MVNYPRNRRTIIAINGTFDPCRDPTEMSEIWHLVGRGWSGTEGLQWSQVTAPGAIGGYAHKFTGKTDTTVNHTYVSQGISPYRNYGFQYFFPPYSPYYWKVRAEFRIRIEADVDNGITPYFGCLGFFLDGNVYTYTILATNTRIPVERCGWFISANDNRVGFGSGTGFGGMQARNSVNQSISYNTWYDIRLEWSFDWFNSPQYILCEMWLNNVKKLNYNWPWPEHWRGDESAGGGSNFQTHTIMGRCGPAINLYHPSSTLDVIGYFKDIVITQVFRPVAWKVEDNIIQAGRVSNAELELVSNRSPSFVEGSDVNIWKRRSLNDDFEPRFRGIIREAVKGKRRKFFTLSAEGYETLLYGEKTNNISHSAKTAKEIVQDAINNPDKGDFNVTTYFESPTTTYNRDYPQNPKIDIIQEMSGLEGFICFSDHKNYWHFQSYRTNQLAKHLIFPSSKIKEIKVTNVYVRRPNLVRVIGKGYVAERELSVDTYSSGSNVVRNFNRFDLTTQAQVDDALDYYCFLMNEPIRAIIISMVADHTLQKGNLIRLTDYTHGIKNRQFLIASVGCSSRNLMTLGLLEAKPHITALLSDLAARTDSKEAEMFPQDAITTTPEFNIEGVATVNITGTYELEYDSTIVRSGDLVITDELIDDIIEFWNMESPNEPTHLGYGTGTTDPLFSDTDLESQTARPAAVVTLKEEITQAADNVYRAVEYEIDVVNPSTVTEIGLFNAASGGTLDCRGVFTSYSQSGTVTFRIRLRIEPVEGLCYVTYGGRDEMINWLYAGTALTTYTHISHYGFNSFIAPNPDVSYRSTYIGYGVNWVPNTAVQGSGSFTKTKLTERNMIKFQHTYGPYNYASHKGADGFPDNPLERFLALRNNHANDNRKQHIVIFHRSTKTLSDYDGTYCKWIIWLKIVSGETEY